MTTISHRLNTRLADITYLVQSERILRTYYESNPIEERRKSMIQDTFEILDKVFDSTNSVFEDEDRLLICAYLYRLKGHENVISEMCRLMSIDLDSFSYTTGGECNVVINMVSTNDITYFYKIFTDAINELLFNSGVTLKVNFVIYNFKSEVTNNLNYSATYIQNLTGMTLDTI